MRIRFRFRWIPFVAASIVIAIGVALGQWQMHRAAYKEAIETKLTARGSEAPLVLDSKQVNADDVEFRRVQVTGEFADGWPIYLENRPYNGVAGFYLLMPLKIAGADLHVLIARGWLPRDPADRSKLPVITTPSGIVQIEGVIRRNPGHLMQLGQGNAVRPGAILQNVDVAEVAAASKLLMQPIVIEQSNDLHDGLVRNWPRPSSGIEKHYGYAVQWYGLAATAFIFFVVTGFRRESKQ
ncbi:MAG: SURF1 family protein [Burkholderiaceae bacterium]